MRLSLKELLWISFKWDERRINDLQDIEHKWQHHKLFDIIKWFKHLSNRLRGTKILVSLGNSNRKSDQYAWNFNCKFPSQFSINATIFAWTTYRIKLPATKSDEVKYFCDFRNYYSFFHLCRSWFINISLNVIWNQMPITTQGLKNWY